MDDFDIEVTRLRRGRDGAPPDASGVTVAPDPRRPRGDSPLTDRRNTRTRLLGTLGAACALLIALAVLASTVPQARDTLRGIVYGPTATPTATLGLGEPIVFFEHMVPWGTLKVNGTQVTVLDLANPAFAPSDGSISFTTILPRGRNMITYDAAPWPSLRCVLMVPIAAGKSTCPLVQPSQDQQTHVIGESRLVDLGATVDNLPPDALASLKSTVTHLFNESSAPATVQPGEQYLTADGTTATAQQPLLATLYRKVLDGQCGGICQVEGVSPARIDLWPVIVGVEEGYTYTTTDGTVIAANVPLVPQKLRQSSTPVDQYTVSLSWNAGWQATVDETYTTPLSCYAATYWLNGAYGGTIVPQMTAQWAAANPADGCVTRVQLIDTANQTQGPPMYLLYRFGQMFVVNQLAASYFTGMPFANAYAEALAQQIIAQHA
ncbi:MAG: hypothetical protein OJF49_003141 [Ktedonobacterales bacterium]|nr:MAG: hypothetical protein OJF49_003141 [Ktedonobacterales bacterium]